MARRRTEEAVRLLNGGYRELVTGKGPRRRYVRACRSKSRRDKKARAISSVPALDPGWFTEPAQNGGRGAMTGKGRYLDTKAAADYLGLSPSTLNRKRVTGDGPRYSKLGRRVIYDVRDLDSWIEGRKRRFTGEGDGG